MTIRVVLVVAELGLIVSSVVILSIGLVLVVVPIAPVYTIIIIPAILVVIVLGSLCSSTFSTVSPSIVMAVHRLLVILCLTLAPLEVEVAVEV